MFKSYNKLKNVEALKHPMTALFKRLSSSKNNCNKENLPHLVYFANPFQHCLAKINFILLKRSIDPEFDENEFKRGASKVIIVIFSLSVLLKICIYV